MAHVTVLGLVRIGLRVHDLARALRFYQLLGFHLARGPFVDGLIAVLRHPTNLVLRLDASESSAPIVPCGTRVALRCADADAAVAVLSAAGYPSAPPQLQMNGDVIVVVRDPDGNVFELHQLAGAESSGEFVAEAATDEPSAGGR